MNAEEKIGKSIEEKIKDLERKVERLEEIRYKYYCLGFMYFFVLGLIFLLSPGSLGDFGSDQFNTNMSLFFFASIIFLAVIFFGELVYKFFGVLFKSKKSP